MGLFSGGLYKGGTYFRGFTLYELIMEFDWKHLLRTETVKKSLLKTFHCSNKGTRKAKDSQRLSNKESYFTLQFNSTKYNNPFKFIAWPNFLEGLHILSPVIWGKTFADWFKRSSDVYLLFNPAVYRMDNISNILCPRCKELFNFKCNLVSRFNQL